MAEYEVSLNIASGGEAAGIDLPQQALGKYIELIRTSKGKTQAEWAEEANINSTSVLSRIENGEQRIKRDDFIRYSTAWGLDIMERTRLLLQAGYLPELPPGFGSNNSDLLLLQNGIREIIECFETGKEPGGFADMLQQRMQSLWAQATPVPTQ